MGAAAEQQDIGAIMQAIGQAAVRAADALAQATADVKNRALLAMAQALRTRSADILKANALDMRTAQERGVSGALLDRLKLDDARIQAMANGVAEVAALPDPIGVVIAEWTRPNGLSIQRVRVPLGVIGIIMKADPMSPPTPARCA